MKLLECLAVSQLSGFAFCLWVCLLGAQQACADADSPLAAKETARALQLHANLQAQVFAAEPMITNPTNIAVDERGRVWVCDVVNYRGNQGKRPEGDRILVLEDQDGDGQADRSTVFYQGHDVDSALGICVLGEKVIVSCSPDVFVLTDEDGDGRADKKQVLYSKTGDAQHDHSAHAFVFGPDGNLYWNIGNTNQGVFDPSGHVMIDVFGQEVRNMGNPYRHGLAFRQSLAGERFEVLAHNLRNSYELTVDAFGRIWFTDNDDDGNLGTRFCFTLEGGNYGYTDEITGQHWRSGMRTGMNERVPLRHWHQNDPGSIPNVLNNGSGSPAGVEVYEGKLLPAALHGGIVHCEPGHNVVRVYLPEAHGAGYQAKTIELIDGRTDPWFRPVDVAAAPDGSLMIADWYDPGVGGHRQADIDRGRIYRIAPPAADYQTPAIDLSSASKCCQQLCSPNHSVRYLAWTALQQLGAAAEETLAEFSRSADPRERVRAYWLLNRLGPQGSLHRERAIKDPDPRVRAATARMLVQNPDPAWPLLRDLADDSSPQVRRAAAIALRHAPPAEAKALWAELATRCNGEDRWELEALGLAADGRWDACLQAWLASAGQDAWRSPAGRKLIWRSRGTQTVDKLAALLTDLDTPQEELPKLLRALDFNDSPNLDEVLTRMIERAFEMPPERCILIATESLHRIKSNNHDKELTPLITRLLAEMPHDDSYVALVKKFRVRSHYRELLEIALGRQAEQSEGVDSLKFLIGDQAIELIETKLKEDPTNAAVLLKMLAQTLQPQVVRILMPFVSDSQADIELRREAVRAIAATKRGSEQLLDLSEQEQLAEPLHASLWFALRISPWDDLKQRAAQQFADLAAADSEALAVSDWMELAGDAKRGKVLFLGKSNCATCHKVAQDGKDIGPSLTEIGSKLSKTGLYEALLYPSAAISHSYESYLALTDAGTTIVGVKVGETEQTVSLKTDKGVVHQLQRRQLESYKKHDLSLMPTGLHKLLTPQELADLVKYLQSLKKSSETNASE
ncbi:MAG: PVC-type heme-binding CxxCH protein [Bythopirellula sp.]